MNSPAAVAGIYHQRHPERTLFYWVLFHYFDEFVAEYENCFEREYGYLRPVIQEVVEKYRDCGNPKCGFATSPSSRINRGVENRGPGAAVFCYQRCKPLENAVGAEAKWQCQNSQ